MTDKIDLTILKIPVPEFVSGRSNEDSVRSLIFIRFACSTCSFLKNIFSVQNLTRNYKAAKIIEIIYD